MVLRHRRPQTRTTTGCCTSAPSPAAPYARARGGTATGPRPPQRRLARPAGAGAGRGGCRRDVETLALEVAGSARCTRWCRRHHYPTRGAARRARRTGCPREPRGLIVAGRQTNPAIAEPVAALAGGRGYPILAEPTSQLRLGPHDRDLVVARLRPGSPRLPRLRSEPGLIVRIGDMPSEQAVAPVARRGFDGLRQVVGRPRLRLNDPSLRAESIVRADPGGARRRAARAGSRGTRTQASWLDGWRETEGVGSPRCSRPSSRASTPRREPGSTPRSAAPTPTAISSTPRRACRSATRRPSSAPGPADVTFLCNRGANGIDGLVSSGIGAAAASGRRTWVVLGDLCLVPRLQRPRRDP